MKSRLLVTIVLAVVVVPLLVAGLGYYYLFATLAGTFSVPALYSARLTAPDGGRMLVEGVGVTGWRARGSRWRARYAPPGSERSEDVGSWIRTGCGRNWAGRGMRPCRGPPSPTTRPRARSWW